MIYYIREIRVISFKEIWTAIMVVLNYSNADFESAFFYKEARLIRILANVKHRLRIIFFYFKYHLSLKNLHLLWNTYVFWSRLTKFLF